MPDSEVLNITESESIKANHVLEEAQAKFTNVNITVTDSKIVLVGDPYEEIFECKQWFALRIGQLNPNARRRPQTHREDEEVLYERLKRYEHTQYITYEKIEIIVIEGKLLDFDEKIDCYVNTTNSKLDCYSKVSSMLKEAGGKPYKLACEKVRSEALKLKTTECVITHGFKKTKRVIHAFCPNQTDYMFSKKGMENDIYMTVSNCLKMAEKHQIQTIAFPFLCTGNGQLDIKVCSQQYAFAVLEFSRVRKSQFVVDTVYFIDTDKGKINTVNEVFRQILPSTEMQLLEVPKQDYHNYFSAVGTTAAFQNPDNNPDESSGEVGGQKTAVHSQRSRDDSSTLQDEENDERRDSEEPYQVENVGEHIKVNTQQEESEFRKKIGKYELIFERGDIRNSETVAIVCPENDGEERGGLLATAIKCTFRQSFNQRKLNKLQKNAVATTEHKNAIGCIQYILHVHAPVWTESCKEREFEKGLKASIEMIFDKLKRHGKRNIQSIAIPLIGINSVENDDVVGKCCEWQIEKTMEILQKREEIPNLREVHFINRCEKIRNMFLTDIKIFLDEKPKRR